MIWVVAVLRRRPLGPVPTVVFAFGLVAAFLLVAWPLSADTGTSLGDRSGEGATPFTGLAQSPEANLFTGALTTQIAIKVPPGRKGMTPQLALQYSSAAGPSSYGHGWDLHVGRIDRSTKWGVPRCTGPHTNDFVLILPGGGAVELAAEGPDQTVFRPLVEESWIEAQFHTQANRWTVRDRNGIRYTFGDHSSARVSSHADGPALALQPDGTCAITSSWMLTRMEDTNGNLVDFEWLWSENVPLLNTVRYGGNAQGIEHFYRISFYYLWRPPSDFHTSHRLGVEQRYTHRLQSIGVINDVDSGSKVIRSYGFHYFDGGVSHSLLNAVTATGEPPQTFVYTPSALGHDAPAQAVAITVPAAHQYLRSWTGSLEVKHSIIDMNGDGKLDLVRGDTFPWTVHFGESDGSDEFGFSPTPVYWSGVSDPHSGSIRNVWVTTSPCNSNGWACTTIDTFDITGDGRVDYVIARDANQPWRVYPGERKPDGSWGFAATPIVWPAPDRFIRRVKEGHTYRDTIDVNGDGLPDLVEASDGQWTVWINYGLGFEADPLPYFPAPVGSISHTTVGNNAVTKHMLADFDGDGLVDLLRHVNAGSPPYCPSPSNGGQTTHRHDCLLLYRNTGQGFATEPEAVPLPFWASGLTIQNGGEVIADLLDVNGDGLPDWVERTANGQQWRVLLNLGGRLESVGYHPLEPYDAIGGEVWPGGFGPLRKTSNARTQIDMIDLNGDGFLDRVVAGSTTWQVQLNALTQKPKLLWMMENGLGGTNTIAYEPSTRYDHTGGDGQPDMPFVSWVVAATRLNDGLCTPPAGANVFDRNENPCIDQGHEILSFHDYQDGRLDIEYEYDSSGTPIAVVDRGFNGFRRVTRSDIDGNQTVTVFGQGHLVRGRVLELHYYAGSAETGSLIRYETNQWASRPLSGGREQVWLHRNGRFTFDLGGAPHFVSTTNHAVDASGNVLHTSVLGNRLPQVDTISEYAVPFGSNGAFPRNRPWQVTTQTVGGVLDRRQFFYDGAPLGTLSAGNMTSSRAWLDTESRWVTTTYGYDTYGNLTLVRDPRGGETTTFYDDGKGTHLYPLIETNPLGHQTVTAMDYDHGKPAVAWGANGTATATLFRYDAAGRLTCEARPGDSVGNCTIATNYVFASGPGQYSTVTVARKQSGFAARRTATTHFDALGRGRFTDVSAVVNGSPVSVRRDRVEFDAAGRLRRKFYPYPASGSPVNGSTTFDYRLTGLAVADPLGRLHETTHSDGTKTRLEYRGERVLAFDEVGNRTDRIYDGLERLVVEEARAGDTVLSSTRTVYDGMGRITAQHQNGQAQPMKSFTYDSLGRRTQVTDRDSGIWRYGYDDSGNLRYRDDPKAGQHVQYCYDAADRPRRICALAQDYQNLLSCNQACSGTETAYTYDEASVPFSRGRLTTVSDDAGRFRVLAYDARGRQRITEREIDVDGDVTVGRFEYEYNDTDEVVRIRYPDGEAVTTTFDRAGQPIGLQNETGTVYVSAVWYDEFGRANLIWHGNGARDERSYYGPAKRHRLSTVATQSGGQFALAQIYDYTPHGKISGIYDFDDSVRTNGGLYEYDALGRLTSFDSFRDQFDRTYQYDEFGNLTRKGTRNLAYGNPAAPSVRPHQMVSVNGVAMVHDGNGNRLTNAAGAQVYSFDEEDRLERISLSGKTVEFLYDHAGERRARVVTDGGPPKVTRYYGDLLHTTPAGKTVKSYFLGGTRVATQTANGTGWAAMAAADSPIQVASAWYGRPVLLLEVSPAAQRSAAVAVLLLFTLIALSPRRRARRSAGMIVRRGHVGAVTLLFVVGALPWPVLVKPAVAQCGGPPPAAAIVHYHVDHLGSTQVITDVVGAVVEHIRYMPYGEVRGRWNGAGDPIPMPGGNQVAFDYTGHERELNSGLIYARARFYDPVLGTFLTPDPAGEFTSPYTYSGWDPVNANDPTGRFIGIAAIIAAFLAGFVVAAIDAAIAGASLGEALKAGLIGGAMSAATTAILGPIGQGMASLDGWARAVATALRVASSGYAVYSAVEAFRNGEYAAGTRAVIQVVSAAFGGLRDSAAGIGAKESQMPAGPVTGFGFTAADVPQGGKIGPLSSPFPPKPPSGTAATLRVTSVTVFGIKVEIGTAWAIDSAGNIQVFDIFGVGFETEVFEIAGVQGISVTDAASVNDLAGYSTALGGSGGPTGIGFAAEYMVGPNYSGVTVYNGVQYGIAPVGAYGVREHWTPRGP